MPHLQGQARQGPASGHPQSTRCRRVPEQHHGRSDHEHDLGHRHRGTGGPVARLEHDSAISCDNIVTVHRNDVGDVIGYLHEADESKLLEAITAAFDLDYMPSV